MPINYEEEATEIESPSDQQSIPWWSQPVGSHKVKILQEGEPYTVNYKNQQIEKVRFLVEIGGQQYNWGVNKGKTTNSLWGQLVMLGKAWNGLQGKVITVIIKTTTRKDGTSIRQFTILEAVELMSEKNNSQNQQNQQKGDLLVLLKGKTLTKDQIIGVLQINDDQFKVLLDSGLIQKKGNNYLVV